MRTALLIFIEGILDCAKKTYRLEGLRGLYRGFLPCIIRSMPVNAAIFLAFETTMRFLGRDSANSEPPG